MKKRLIIMAMIIASAMLAGCGAEMIDGEGISETEDVATGTDGDDSTDNSAEEAEEMDENWISLELKADRDNEAWNLRDVVEEFEITDELEAKLKSDSTKDLELVDIIGAIDFTGEGKDSEVFKLAETSCSGEESDEVYKVYITNAANIIISTPDESYIGLDSVSMIDFIRGEIPRFSSYDFDGDSEAELLIEASNLHGTEYAQETVFIVDKDSTGNWKVFHITPDGLISKIDEKVDIMYSSTHIRYEVDGKEAYLCQRKSREELSLSMDSNLYYGNREEVIVAEVGPILHEGAGTGIFTAPIQVHINYEGAGKWSINKLFVEHGTIDDFADAINVIGKNHYYAIWDDSSFDRAFLLVADREDGEAWQLMANGNIVSDRCDIYSIVAGKPVKIGNVEAQGLGILTFTKEGYIAIGISHELSEYSLNESKTAVTLNAVYCDDAIALNGVVGPAKYDGNETKHIEMQEYLKVCQAYSASSHIEFEPVN